MLIHTLFDLLAAASALAMTTAVYVWRLRPQMQRIEQVGVAYAVALVAGAVLGGYGAGSLNLWLTGLPGIGRSVVGALAGAIVAIELLKRRRGIRGSTGIVFVPGFVTSVAVGRWGCFLSGLDDQTHGTVTGLPWGHDFGDGLLRHPVQLYESFAMTLFLGFALAMLARRSAYFLAKGFYLMVFFYAGQRFLWEFLKPYGALAGPFNLFHLICAGLMVYSLSMLWEREHRA
jgi:prolipoprotein diacylglyceryltransferase